MKLTIRKWMIKGIPVLEVVQEELAHEPLPLIIFYHGWQTNKELLLTQGRKLADQGFRAVLPDGMHHGERKVAQLSSIPSVTFFSTIQFNIVEFQVLVDYFKERELIRADLIGVGGYSMGGMTTAALLTSRPEIKVAASIMGTPQPTLYSQNVRKHALALDLLVPQELSLVHSWLPAVDLSLHPAAIAKRPVLFWHGTEDPKIPFSEPFDFYQKVKEEAYGEQVEFIIGQGEGHLVTTELMETIANYFALHLK